VVLGAVAEPDAVQDAPVSVPVSVPAPDAPTAAAWISRFSRALAFLYSDDRPDAARRLAEARRPGLVAEDPRLPGARALEPEQDAHRGRLARAVGPEQADDAALGDREGHRSSRTARRPKRLTSPSNSIGGGPAEETLLTRAILSRP
jgi:hypothetical protein